MGIVYRLILCLTSVTGCSSKVQCFQLGLMTFVRYVLCISGSFKASYVSHKHSSKIVNSAVVLVYIPTPPDTSVQCLLPRT